MSCLSPAAFLLCNISFLLSPLLVVSLDNNLFLVRCTVLQQRHLLKFTDYLMQLLLSVSHSMSCLSPDVPLTCSVSFLLSPPTIVSLAHYSPFDLFYSPETMTTTFKFTVYPTQLLFQCLHDLSPSAVLSSCSVSFLPSPFPVVSLTYYTLYDIPTVLQQCTSLQLCCFLT
jgi:hypothetical protein